MPKTDPDQGWKSKIGLPTAGVSVDFGGPKVWAEVGALYAIDAVSFTTPFGDGTIKMKGFQFPALVRFGLGPSFNVGVGGFYGMGTDVCQEVLGVEQCADPAEKGNYGASAALGVRTPGGFRIDARYNMGLKDLAPDAGEFKMSNIQLLVGFRFGGK
jgi:hypothetical protein